MEKQKYLKSKAKYILILLPFLIYILAAYPFINDRAKLEKLANEEFGYIYKGSYKKTFSGPYLDYEDENGARFYWFSKDGCDTIFAKIYVSRQIFTEPISSEFHKKCDDD
ncbi:hypothetical protein [Aquiflexum gelatinilyticum]|uniref:hypothetical protein n=1 Tax=Aquiflexum gelatinilyticum TaxID=2961943 RepID=UPI002167B948|nr:hypothetical protein [Aquiflexum gelatinilyticum]MCS4436494.1 hypothetical protein [Aquiflexum gelatinilyticum]